jgi:hypothetical protein
VRSWQDSDESGETSTMNASPAMPGSRKVFVSFESIRAYTKQVRSGHVRCPGVAETRLCFPSVLSTPVSHRSKFIVREWTVRSWQDSDESGEAHHVSRKQVISRSLRYIRPGNKATEYL